MRIATSLRHFFCWLTLAAPGFLQSSAVAETAYRPTWESLQRYDCPDWFRDAKFGVYAHWGPYSAAMCESASDWYSHYMYQPGHRLHAFHEKTYGPAREFGYAEFIPRFKAERFDAEAWAALFAEAGARFAGPVAEHADGFAMWRSELTPWNAAAMGPKRDVVGELERAIRGKGLRFMASLHHQWKWAWYPTHTGEVDLSTPRMAALYGPAAPAGAWEAAKSHMPHEAIPPGMLPTEEFCDAWLAKTREVIDRYGPDLLWFDNRMNILPPRYRQEMAAHYYNRSAGAGRDVVLTYKDEEMERGTAVLDLERTRMTEIYPDPWLCDMSIATNSWSYTTRLEYYSADRLIHDLVDIVSKNGCLLLNIAPAPDGTIPAGQQERLRAMGAWLRVNGEAVYGTRPWKVFGEGPAEIPQGHLADLKFEGFTPRDIRFTTKPGVLYATTLGWPGAGEAVRIQTLGENGSPEVAIRSVSLLGHDGELTWRRTGDALLVTLPENLEQAEAAVLKLEVSSAGN